MSENSVISIGQVLRQYRDTFDPAFADYFDQFSVRFGRPKESEQVDRALELIKNLSLRGGKRQRVAFLYEAARLVTDEPPPGLAESAFSIELLQTHLLIHDDLIDNAPTRRGAPTTYYDYLAEHPQRPKVALGFTVLAGDLSAFMALDVLRSIDVTPAVREALVQAQVQAGMATFAGQIFDLERDLRDGLSIESLYELADYKAARSSSLAPLEMGVILAGGDLGARRGHLAEYSLLLGVAGQLHDDYLGMFGEEDATGKSSTSDLREGRRTYLIRGVQRVCTPVEWAEIERLLGNEEAADEEFDFIRETVRAYGIDAEIREKAASFASRASAEAASWNAFWSPEAVSFFESLPTWGVERAS